MHTLQGRDLTDAELRGLVMEVDTDFSGTIEFSEFLNLMGRRTSNDVSGEDMRKSFGMYDKDGDGYITATELRQVMAELGRFLSLPLSLSIFLLSVRHACIFIDDNSICRQ